MPSRPLTSRVIPFLIFGIIQLVPSISFGQSNTDAKLAIGTFIVTRVTDLSLTEYGLGSGKVVEANPVFKLVTIKGPTKAGIVHGIGTAGISYAMWELRNQPVWLRATTYIGLNLFSGYVMIHNARILK